MEIIKATARRGDSNWVAEFTYDGTLYTATGTTWKRLHEAMYEALGEKGHLGIHVAWSFEDPELEALFEEYNVARSEAIGANRRLEEALRAAARTFANISNTRDTGAILGYSHQYVAKVIK